MGARVGRGGGAAHRYAVVMAGGVGSRFWPHSRRARPKQFLNVQGRDSLLEATVRRLHGLVSADRVYVVAGPEFAPLIRDHLPDLPAENLIVEPVARGTAPCLGLAARVIERRDPQGVMAVFPADHVIAPLAVFQRAVRGAFAIAERERCLVTFGIEPTGPATGFGYIEVAEALQPAPAGAAAFWTNRFVEKPDVETARAYLSSGRYLWNSGMFVWRADVLRAALERHQPAIAAAVERVVGGGGTGRGRGEFAGLRSVSIDVAVMEKADRVAVVAGGFGWNDVGSWAAMEALWPRDGDGNALRGPVLQIDSRNNIARAGDRLLAMIGVEDLIVVDSPDAILICPKSRAEEVRRIVDALAAGKGGKYL